MPATTITKTEDLVECPKRVFVRMTKNSKSLIEVSYSRPKFLAENEVLVEYVPKVVSE